MSNHLYGGLSGHSYDRWVERNSNHSTLGKVQKQFWFTKSAVLRKFGKKEDEHIVASDAELDSKIDLFNTIESTTKELQGLIAEYQTKICILAQEENTLGRLLKEYGKQDETIAGKMMLAVGKCLSYTAQHRVAMRNPLVRLFQEVDTFHTRAVEDTQRTVEEMEKIRTEYRGALMWMKNISQDFNPDQYQQLEKFREVQGTVKLKKSKFDLLKVKCLQKIELLAASRCNMFSHALILYQNNLITFSEKTAKTLSTIATNFQGYHPYKFQIIKELVDPLALQDSDEESDKKDKMSKDDMIFDSEYKDEIKETKSESLLNLLEYNEPEASSSVANDTHTKVANKEENYFSNVDLLTNNTCECPDAEKSTQDLLKELFDSPVHTVPGQSLPIFGCADLAHSFASPGDSLSAPDPSSSKIQNNQHLFLPSQLLDFGFNDLPNYNNDLLSSSLLSTTTHDQSLNLTQMSMASSDMDLTPSSASSISPSLKKMNIGSVRGPINSANLNKKLPNQTLKEEANKLDWNRVFQNIDPLADPASAIFGIEDENKQC